ncbi:hypothetical protein NMY22_g13227 [Coprinellus aureogranulatus]|nr:hypothetical protein NMY22_g13227 [Coprinellus aureogranulatus]
MRVVFPASLGGTYAIYETEINETKKLLPIPGPSSPPGDAERSVLVPTALAYSTNVVYAEKYIVSPGTKPEPTPEGFHQVRRIGTPYPEQVSPSSPDTHPTPAGGRLKPNAVGFVTRKPTNSRIYFGSRLPVVSTPHCTKM